jgi:organic radical activating enzyme
MSKTIYTTYRGATPSPAEATREAIAASRLGFLPIVETFYSLQGEGLRSGKATVFARFAGCNCDCWFCDTDFRLKERMSESDLLDRIDFLGPECQWVCLTGGEPTIHDLKSFCDRLHERGKKVQIETNGSLARPEWGIDHITVSPKERQGRALDLWYYESASEFKYVIGDNIDLDYALTNSALHASPSLYRRRIAVSR